MTYTPSLETEKIMTWCLRKIQSIPYRVTLRWIFYQAFQHIGLTKDDYARFKGLTSRVRKNFWGGWKPDTLVDDQRNIFYKGGGPETVLDWYKQIRDLDCTLDKRYTQNKIIIICFEAAAMHSQFEYYTKDYYVTLVPFRGDASIEFKWRIAKWIEQLIKKYQKPVKILYFGDLDQKGEEIPENALRDIRKWCLYKFEYAHIGLKKEHVTRWNLPENPEKHGYQWEALDDDAARELIQGALDKEIDLGAIGIIKEEETEAETGWKKFMDAALKNIDKKEDEK